MDWKSVVGKVAPMLGVALAGPLGGVAVATIADALGLSEKTEAAITEALAGTTPEQLMALKNADQAFAVKMQEIGFANAKDIEALVVGDRDSARKREMEVKDNTPRNLAYGITVGFFSVLLFIMTADVQEGMKEVLYIMLGALGASWQACMSYYFGSTKGSQIKTELLAASTPAKDAGAT